MVDTGGGCASCGAQLPTTAAPTPGQAAVYCSNACRQRAYRRRQRAVKAATVDDAPSPRANVPPLAVDSFVGRQNEIASIARLLRNSRLITLFGPAGVGKTRMALEVANRVQRAFSGGVYLVELGSLTRPEFVAQAVAAAVGVCEQPATPLTETLAASLHGERALLVLDNCEHLVEACGQFAVSLLRRCPGPHILATSREALRLPGEMIFTSDVLPLDDAVELFADRASAVAPDFKPDSNNRRLTELICERLDRLPLAIELAARMVRLFPLQDIVDRLEDRFTLLSSCVRETDARHRDLLTAIDWSYELLSPTEQAVFRRLAMLPGGFNLELVGAVCADLELSAAGVIKVVSGLESKSLIAATPGPRQQARFRQLESIRAYARRRLDDAGEFDVAAEQLVAWMTRLATPQLHRFLTNGEGSVQLELEYENLLHAVEYLASGTDDRQVLLAAALMCCGDGRAATRYGRDRLAAVLQVSRDPQYRAFALEQAAWLAARDGDHDEALVFATEAADLARQYGSTALRCRTLTALGYARQVRGDLPQAIDSFTACVELVRQLAEPGCVALALNNLAWASMLGGDRQRAAELVAEALPGCRRGKASLLHTAGVVALEGGDPAAAFAAFAESLRCLDPLNATVMPYLLEGFALAAVHEGRVDRGLRLAGAAETINRKSGHVGDRWWRERVETAVAGALARLPEWRGQALLAEGRALPVPRAQAYALDDAWGDQQEPEADSLPLTQREYEVAGLVAQGLTNREVARRLRVSERTVEAHLEHIRARLDLRSRAQIAAWIASVRVARTVSA